MAQPKFYITDDSNLDDGATWREINPGGENFTLIDEEFSDEQFSRVTMNGKLKLRRADYDFVMSRPFSAMFTVILVRPGQAVSVSQAEWRGEFFRTDCEILEDEGRIEVPPRTVDVYKTVIEGMSKKFDLIEIEPPLTPLTLTRRAVLQIYVRGAQKVTNYVDSAFFEEVAVNPSEVNSILQGDYRFGYSGRKYFITGSGAGLSPDISGTYIYNAVTFESTREDGLFKMFFNNGPGVNRVQIERISDGAIVYEGGVGDPIPNVPVEDSQGVLLTSLTDPSSKCRAFYVDFYSRILTNAATVDGNATFPVPATDIVESTGVFSRVHQIFYTNFLTSEANSPTGGTRWGRFPDDAEHFAGNHYQRPTGAVYYPVLQSNWVDASFWVEYDAQLVSDMEEASQIYTVEHAYKIVDVVSALLESMGSDVTHEEAAEFSDFLYAASNTIRGVFKTPMIVPITNILVGDYDEPQPVAKISLQDIMELYYKALKVKWYIDEEKRFVWEHIKFFENGGTYGSPIIGTDLTSTVDAWNGLPLGTAQDRYKFERDKMPERFEFSWQGKASKPFIGYPMDINSPFVEKGNIEKWDVGLFNPDIDLINVGGSEVSKEGFLFVEAIRPQKVYQTAFVEVVVDSEEEYNLQNGYAAFVWLVPNLHRYNLPASDIKVNRYPSTAITVARRKIQEINISTAQDVGTLALTKTNLGDGQAYRVESEVFTNKKKITLRHVTE